MSGTIETARLLPQPPDHPRAPERRTGGLELPAKVVQHRLGDSSTTVTLDTSGHLFPRRDDGR